MSVADGRIVVGWVDSNIKEVVDTGLLSKFKFVLITSLDSDVEPAGSNLGQKILSFSPDCSFLGTGVLVPGPLVKQIEAEFRFFHGFDELWCFQERPRGPKPPNVTIVAPLNFTEEAMPEGLLEWINFSGCKLALGDGFGLNFVMPEEQFNSWLWQAFG